MTKAKRKKGARVSKKQRETYRKENRDIVVRGCMCSEGPCVFEPGGEPMTVPYKER